MRKYHRLNIRFQNVALLCFIFFSFFVSPTQAVTIEKTELDLNKKIKITGACDGDVLNVQIFFATSSQPFYTAGADCYENKFEFIDDLGYWKIPDGEYEIAVIDEDNNLFNSSNTAMFKIESAIPPLSDANTIEPTINLENSFISAQENGAAKIEISDQEEAFDQTAILENPSNGLFARIINFLLEWFKSAIIIIKELVVEKVTTPELCLGKTCIIEGQLKDLLSEKQKIEAAGREPEVTSTISDTIVNITN